MDLGAVRVVRLPIAGAGTFDVRPSDRFGSGTLHEDAATGQWEVRVLTYRCGAGSGLYDVARSGRSLVFNVVTDTCQVRRLALDGAVFAPLTNPDQLTG